MYQPGYKMAELGQFVISIYSVIWGMLKKKVCVECFIDLGARENLQDAVSSLPLSALQSEGQTALSHSLFQPLPLCCAVMLGISTI